MAVARPRRKPGSSIPSGRSGRTLDSAPRSSSRSRFRFRPPGFRLIFSLLFSFLFLFFLLLLFSFFPSSFPPSSPSTSSSSTSFCSLRNYEIMIYYCSSSSHLLFALPVFVTVVFLFFLSLCVITNQFILLRNKNWRPFLSHLISLPSSIPLMAFPKGGKNVV